MRWPHVMKRDEIVRHATICLTLTKSMDMIRDSGRSATVVANRTMFVMEVARLACTLVA